MSSPQMRLKEIGLSLQPYEAEAGKAALERPAANFPKLLCEQNDTNKLQKCDYFYNMFKEGRRIEIETCGVKAEKQALIDQLKVTLPLKWEKSDIESVIKNYAKSEVSFSDLQEFFGDIEISKTEECYAKLQAAMNGSRLPKNISDFFTKDDVNNIAFSEYIKEKMPANEDDDAVDFNPFDDADNLPAPCDIAELPLELAQDLNDKKQRALIFINELWGREVAYFEELEKLSLREAIIDSKSPNVFGVISIYMIETLFKEIKKDHQDYHSRGTCIIKGKNDLEYIATEDEATYFKNVLSPVTKSFIKIALEMLEKDTEEVESCMQQFDAYAEMRSKTPLKIESVFPKLETWIKEQGVHSLTRFQNLITYYTSFINSILNLSKATDRVLTRFNEEAKPTLIQNIVKDIFKYSHLKIDQIKPGVPDEANKQRLKLITVYHKGHRAGNIMGREAKEEKFTPAETTKIIETFNLCMGRGKKHLLFDITVKQLDRAHTLPFPVTFAWKAKRVRKLVADQLGKPIAPKLEHEIHFSKLTFQEILKETDHQKIEMLFSEAFAFEEQRAIDAEKFILQTLKLVSSFYMRLFSETELMFDFMNKKIDMLSEWKKSDTSYKEELAKTLTELLDKGAPVDKKSVAQALKTYFIESQEAIDKYKEGLDAALEKDKLPSLLFLKICALQVEEGLALAEKIAK